MIVEVLLQVNVPSFLCKAVLAKEPERSLVSFVGVHKHDPCVPLDKKVCELFYQFIGYFVTLARRIHPEPQQPAIPPGAARLSMIRPRANPTIRSSRSATRQVSSSEANS
jgi:hypothetical protein